MSHPVPPHDPSILANIVSAWVRDLPAYSRMEAQRWAAEQAALEWERERLMLDITPPETFDDDLRCLYRSAAPSIPRY